MGVEASPKRSWRLKETALASLDIEKDKQGCYLLVVTYSDGHRLESDVTSAIQEAINYELEAQTSEDDLEFRQEVKALRAELSCERSLRERAVDETVALTARVKELEKEVEFARGWLRKLTGQDG